MQARQLNRVHLAGRICSQIVDSYGMDTAGAFHLHAVGMGSCPEVSRASTFLETSCVGVRAFPEEVRELPEISAEHGGGPANAHADPHQEQEDYVESFVMQGHCSRLFHATEVLVADPLRQVRTMFILAWIATSCKFGGRDFGRC